MRIAAYVERGRARLGLVEGDPTAWLRAGDPIAVRMRALAVS